MFILSNQLLSQSLVGLTSKEITDSQFNQFYAESISRNYSREQIANMAIGMGLSTTERDNFMLRYDSIRNSDVSLENEKKIMLTPEKDTVSYIPEKNVLASINPNNSIFGQEFFQNYKFKPFKYGNSVVEVAPNYLIGAGDELTISIYGRSLVNRTFKVDKKGFIEFPGLWRLNLSGLTFFEASELLRSRLKSNFNLDENQFSLTLNFARNISVNVMGEVLNPGTYNLPATNSAFHFIAIAGGPTHIGTMRKIKVYRNGSVIKLIDLYDFLNNASTSDDVYLKDGDQIFVETSGPRTKVMGSVRRPMQYETLENETVLDVIRLAGGFEESANTSSIKIKRSILGKMSLVDVPYGSFESTLVKAGDELLVGGINDEITEYIIFYGAVRYPGKYDWNPEFNINDYISLAGGFADKADVSIYLVSREDKNFIRKSFKENFNDSLRLKNRDEVYVLNQFDLGTNLEVSINGAVNNPTNFSFAQGATLRDAIIIAGGGTFDADFSSIEISRINPDILNSKRSQIFRLSVPEEFKFENVDGGDLDFKLEAYDQITIRKIPNFKLQKQVIISGEVKYPGAYAVENYEERIDNLLNRSGGLSDYADLNSAILFRKGVDNVILRGSKVVKSNKAFYDFILVEGDSLYIPKRSGVVRLSGNGLSFNENGVDRISVPFVPNKRANFFVKEYALGFAKNAKRKELFVTYSNGKLDRTKSYLFWKVYPKVLSGGEIRVSSVEKKDREPREIIFDINQIVGTVAASLSSFATVYVLVTR